MPAITTKYGTRSYCKDRVIQQPCIRANHAKGVDLQGAFRPRDSASSVGAVGGLWGSSD